MFSVCNISKVDKYYKYFKMTSNPKPVSTGGIESHPNPGFLSKVKAIPLYIMNKASAAKTFAETFPGKTAYYAIFVLYIILVITLFMSTSGKSLANYGGYAGFLTIMGGFIIAISYFMYTKKRSEGVSPSLKSILYPFLTTSGKIMTIFAVIIIVTIIVTAALYSIGKFPNISSFFMYVANAFILIGLAAIAVKHYGLDKNSTNSTEKATWLRWLLLFKDVALYLPCLLISFVDYLKYQYNITTRPIIILCLLEILFIFLYFVIPYIIQFILTHDANQLVASPINLNNYNKLGTFQDLNYVDKNINYKYAISSWIYLDSFPPETNASYSEFTSLLNIGNKPNILFNVSLNKLLIKMKVSQDQEEILYESSDKIKYQKWNHFVFNYDSGILDVFINNELVASVQEVVPYKEFDIVSCGSNEGIHGGISNVLYFNHVLGMPKITSLYLQGH